MSDIARFLASHRRPQFGPLDLAATASALDANLHRTFPAGMVGMAYWSNDKKSGSIVLERGLDVDRQRAVFAELAAELCRQRFDFRRHYGNRPPSVWWSSRLRMLNDQMGRELLAPRATIGSMLWLGYSLAEIIDSLELTDTTVLLQLMRMDLMPPLIRYRGFILCRHCGDEVRHQRCTCEPNRGHHLDGNLNGACFCVGDHDSHWLGVVPRADLSLSLAEGTPLTTVSNLRRVESFIRRRLNRKKPFAVKAS